MFGAPDMNSGLTSLHEACLMADSLQEYGWTPHVTIIIDEPEIIGNALPMEYAWRVQNTSCSC